MHRNIPRVPLLLGLGGVIPFALFAGALLLGFTTVGGFSTLHALIVYAAVILSFLGGVEWGIGLIKVTEAERNPRFVSSVVPSIAAWIAALNPGWYSLLLMLVILVAMGVRDQTQFKRDPIQKWYPKLRLMLTVLVGVCLAIGAFGAYRLSV
jgi:hypothetical protein